MADKHKHAGARIQILRESFRHVSPEQGTILVGILFESRFVLKTPIWNPTTGTSEIKEVNLEPLDPQAGAILVADAFGLDCDDLYHRFQREWGALRNSGAAQLARSTIKAHTLVERLKPCSPLE